MEQDPIIQKAIAKAGNAASLAAALGITRHAVYQWKRIPVDRVVAVERATGIPRAELRPDVFGEAA